MRAGIVLGCCGCCHRSAGESQKDSGGMELQGLLLQPSQKGLFLLSGKQLNPWKGVQVGFIQGCKSLPWDSPGPVSLLKWILGFICCQTFPHSLINWEIKSHVKVKNSISLSCFRGKRALKRISQLTATGVLNPGNFSRPWGCISRKNQLQNDGSTPERDWGTFLGGK